MNLKHCSSCKLVYYCLKSCQKRHWSEHQTLCKAIRGQLNQNKETLRGLGDSSDTGMFVSHLPPKKHAKIAKLVGWKCSIKSLVNDVDIVALWDTGAQVSILPEHILSDNFPDLKLQDIGKLLGANSGLNLTATNGTAIPYKGWVEAKFQLNWEDEKEVTVPFLVTPEWLEQPIVGYNVIEPFLQGDEGYPDCPSVACHISETATTWGKIESKEMRIPQTSNIIPWTDSVRERI